MKCQRGAQRKEPESQPKAVGIIRPMVENRDLFIYVALDKAKANLGRARIQLKEIEGRLSL